MSRFTRMLTGFDSTPAADPPGSANVESDFVVILAALLCALICVVGLIAVVRCAWLRRSGSASSSPSQAAANKGLKKKILQSLPKFTYGSSAAAAAAGAGSCKFASTECAICLGEFAQGDEVRVLPQCGHGFHVGCIDTWLGSHSSCPSCRQILMATRCQKCGQFQTVSSSSCAGTTAAADSKARESNSNVNNNNQHHTVIAGFLP